MNAKQIVRENWKPVTISGMTGILMGAGTMYASQKLTTDEMSAVVESSEQPLQEASVEGCKSFRDAFQAARAEFGPLRSALQISTPTRLPRKNLPLMRTCR